MNDEKYLRTIEDLERIGSKWWPMEVREEANKTSILKTLLDSQDEFISILKLTKVENGFMFQYAREQKAETDLIAMTNLFKLIDASGMRLNLFLKHLAILSDFGAEPLKRLNTNFKELFPDGWLEANVGLEHNLKYKFQALPQNGTLSNAKMKIDTKENLVSGKYNQALCEDLIMILMFGSLCVNTKDLSILKQCNLYDAFWGIDSCPDFPDLEKKYYYRFIQNYGNSFKSKSWLSNIKSFLYKLCS